MEGLSLLWYVTAWWQQRTNRVPGVCGPIPICSALSLNRPSGFRKGNDSSYQVVVIRIETIIIMIVLQ